LQAESSDDEQEAGSDEDEDDDLYPDLSENETTMRVRILPLYSLLPTWQQMQVFEPAAPGSMVGASAGERLIVVATNVAETSLTIPNIKYVVDAGREKTRHYDRTTGLSSYRIGWVSQASAAQRAGRAGRTGPGHCYRMYSSAVFTDQFDVFAAPEIARIPLEGTILHLKSMGIDDVARFPFPTPPDAVALQAALRLLTTLGALQAPTARALAQATASARAQLIGGQGVPTGGGAGATAAGAAEPWVDPAVRAATTVAATQRITPLGRTLAVLPVAPRFGKMLALGDAGGCLAFAAALVASLCVEELFYSLDADAPDGQPPATPAMATPSDDADAGLSVQAAKARAKEAARQREAEEARQRASHRQGMRAARAKWSHTSSDLLTNLRVLGAFDHVAADQQVAFCAQNFLIHKSMLEAQELRYQLCRILSLKFPALSAASRAALATPRLMPPSTAQERLLCQLVAAGLIDRVARKWPQDLTIVMPDGTEFSGGGGAYQVGSVVEPVYLHPSSGLFAVANQPEYCTYVELLRTTKRTYIKGVTAVRPEWLPNLAPAQCSDTLLDQPPPRYDAETDALKVWVETVFGAHRWVLPRRAVDFPSDAPEWAVSSDTSTFQVGGACFTRVVACAVVGV
jgi:ATP-dependent RNA helicase DHX37/DHR1